MLFWTLLVISFGTAVLCGSILDSIWLGVLIYFGLAFASFGVLWVASLLLGRRDQFVLRENNDYEVIYMDDNIVKIYNGEILPRNELHNTVYTNDVPHPVLEVKRFNIGGWRRTWLAELYDDEFEYTLYLPVEKTEG